MSIDFRKYINITSGVGAGASVRRRDLIGRLLTQNALVSPGAVLEFTTLDQVASYFGTTSEEYLRAAFYFGWVSKITTRAKKISYARYAPTGAAPRVFGNTTVKDLNAIKAITAGSLRFVLGGTNVDVSGLNFSAAASLADVASTLQTAVNANANVQLATATVAYDAVSRRFNFVGGQSAATTLSIGTPAAGTDVAPLIGWQATNGAIYTNGADAKTAVQTLTDMNSANNNYASFLFMGAALSDTDTAAVAAYNKTLNVAFMYCVAVSASNAASLAAALEGIGGTQLTLTKSAGQYAEMCPMIILAATDYERIGSAANYMYQQFPGLEVTVDTDPNSDLYDGLGVNYNGRTQSAGQQIDFYQRGYMMGGATDPTDQNVYANEIWLKDYAGSSLMTLMLALNRVSANAAGRGQIMGALQEPIEAGLRNGVISVGKELSTAQKTYIAEVTADDRAWQQVQTIGYWLNAWMTATTLENGRVEYKCVYLLLYSKDDTVRSIGGTHTLI